jgi:hypothetical protein
MRADSIPLRVRLWFSALALPFLVPGLYLIGVGLHWFPVDPARVHAPGWVIAICGLIFASAGWCIFDTAWKLTRDPFKWMMVTLLLGMTAVSGWVAFGPGERRFGQTRYVGEQLLVERGSTTVNETKGRRMFGTATVLLVLGMGIYAVVQVRRRRAKAADAKPRESVA